MSAEMALLPLEEFGFQVCKGCGEKKPLSGFYRHKKMLLGVLKKCKECHAAAGLAWVEKNPDKYFDALLRRRYGGFTLEQYNARLAEQGGRCGICGVLPTDPRNFRGGNVRAWDARLCVDHDHATGEVRGLLCNSCNKGIGLLGDDAAIVRAAMEYLERPPPGEPEPEEVTFSGGVTLPPPGVRTGEG